MSNSNVCLTLSLKGADQWHWKDIDGEDHILPGGMGQVMDRLAEGYVGTIGGTEYDSEPLDVRLNAVVTDVRHGPGANGGCRATCG